MFEMLRIECGCEKKKKKRELEILNLSEILKERCVLFFEIVSKSHTTLPAL